MSRFVHLHVHDEFSLADGMSKIDQLVARAKELRMDALATTNHGNMFSVAKFYKACKKNGIKPIIGSEAYICPEGKEARVRNNRHIVLLCKNEIGYHNLIRIMSEASIDGYYYNPRTDYESLKKYSEGLICLTACLGGDVAKAIEVDGYEAGLKKLDIYIDIFGRENIYLELQDNKIEEQYVLNDHLIRMSRETGIPLVATNDIHYIRKEDYEYHDILMAIQGGTTVDSTNRKKYESDEFYLKSYDEMNTGRLPIEALDNTGVIADRCNFDMEFGHYHLPKFDVPDEFANSKDYLKYLAYNGMKERYPDFERRKEELTERLDYELSVIDEMGFNDYFLITWDFVDYAKKNDIAVGPGRGCLISGTQILMNNGSSKNIEDVSVGDKVITHKGRIKEVYNTPAYQVEEGMYSIKAGGFDPIVATADHKILTLVTDKCKAPSEKRHYCTSKCPRCKSCKHRVLQEVKWIAASELKNGDMLCYPKIKLRDKSIVISDLASNMYKQTYYRNDFIEDEDYFYVRINNISKLEHKGLVYDLSVEEDTSFIANGFAVHNSAAGSVLSYALRITDIDPIRFGLIFERFLNPDRVSLPDIDIDFCYERRQEVIDYVVNKYGADRVCQIITFGTMAARSAIRSVGRATKVEYLAADKIAKSIPEEIGITIKDALEINPELKAMYEKEEPIKRLIDASIALEGLPSNTSTHAAGVLISPEKIENIFPVWVNRSATKKEAVKVVQFDMNILEELGGLKCDFLGLRTLTVISDTLELIYKNHKVRLTPQDMLDIVDDPTAYHMIAEGCTLGVFQLEGQGMTQVAKELRPETIDEVTALVALYRPGPMDMIPQYIKNKKNPDQIDYVFDDLKDVLKETYGILVYQEQVMFTAQILAGYSMANADELRKAISKKNADLIAEHKEYFIYGKKDKDGNILIPGGIAKGHDEQKLIHLYDEIEKFGRYCFNKSHAVVYAVIAAQTAWLKKHFPSEFMASLLSSVTGNQDKVRMYMEHCEKRFGIKVYPPSINNSTDKFVTDSDGNIRFALSVAKKVGSPAAREIAYQRSLKGDFISFSDFLYRCYGGLVTSATVEGLIKSGAFDELGLKKSELLAVQGNLIEEIKKMKSKEKKSSQNRLFENSVFSEDMLPSIKEIPDKILLKMEKESLGIYLSGHPLDNIKAYIEVLSTVKTSDFKEEVDEDLIVLQDRLVEINQEVEIVGIISGVKQVKTKKGDLMAFASLEDNYGFVDLVIFPRQYARYKHLLIDDSEIYIKGTVGQREDEDPSILVNVMTDLDQQTVHIAYLAMDFSTDNNKLIDMRNIIKECSGDIPIYISYNKKYILLNRNLWISKIGIEALKKEGYNVNMYRKIKGEI